MNDGRAMTQAGATRPVSSVVQAVAILRHLGARPGGAGVNAIARATAIGPSSCFNVLRTLVGEGMVNFDPQTKLYSLGLGAIDLARAALRSDAVVTAAHSTMAALAERHDATVGLWRLSAPDRVSLVALAESGSSARIHLPIGQRQPLGAGASGRAVLADRRLPDRAILDAYAAIRWRDAPGAEQFLAQVRAAETRGWAEDIGNINPGVTSLATVIRDTDGAVSFVLAVSIFSGRESGEGLAAIAQDLLAQARATGAAVYGTPAQGK